MENFKHYIDAFEKKLDLVNIDNISATLYCKKYLTHLLRHKKYYLEIYADVLNKLIQHSTKNKGSILLVDYGAGNGLLGIFAKYCGFKKVFLTDIDADFIQASEKLSSFLDISIDGFVTGDINFAQSFFINEAPDAIVGTDVIEHIYNLEYFFSTIQQMNPSMVSIFTTASNPNNYYKVRMLKKMQLKDELEGGSPEDHILFGGSPLEPFLKIREQIIRKNADDLPEKEIQNLAKATRGLNSEDIVKAVAQYKIANKIPVQLSHETNTCHPLNGSWSERILSLNAYNLLYNSAGFKIVFYNGFYNVYEGGFNNYVKKILNACIAIFGNKISPYIIIVGY